MWCYSSSDGCGVELFAALKVVMWCYSSSAGCGVELFVALKAVMWCYSSSDGCSVVLPRVPYAKGVVRSSGREKSLVLEAENAFVMELDD